MSREQQGRKPYYEFANAFKTSRQGEKKCLALVNGSACGGSVIRAHSVSRSAVLSLIARNGYVYQANADPFAIAQSDGEIKEHLVPIRSATTFTGFCSSHDQSLFKAIDVEILCPTKEQVALLHYRALCRELYVKRPTLASNQALREADLGKSEGFQHMVQGIVNARDLAIKKSLEELEVEKADCDKVIQSRDFSKMCGVVVNFSKRPTIACSGLTQPIYDFAGNELQNLRNMSVSMARLSFTLLPSSVGGVAVIAWLPASDAVCRKFVDSFILLKNAAKTSALIRWAFDSFENKALQPSWWESLNQDQLNELQLAAHHWTDMSLMIDSASLVPTASVFDDWGHLGETWI